MMEIAAVESDIGWGPYSQEIPQRSRLYSLRPIGVGTGEIESATSYIARLAAAHTVSPWALVKHEIAEQFYGQDAIIRNRLSELFAAVGSAFNGENETCRKIVAILESLTGRSDLSQMTMAFCRGVVSSRLLLRRYQAWCPECLSKWKQLDQPIYMPLLWNLRAVRVCPHHGIPLSDKCPSCGRGFYPLKARSKVGCCPDCGVWLGTSVAKDLDAKVHGLVDQAISMRVADFLRDVPSQLAGGALSHFARNIDLFHRSGFDGNLKALAGFVGVDRFTIKFWKKGTQVPSLLSLADLSIRTSLPCNVLLLKALEPHEISFPKTITGNAGKRVHAAAPQYDLAAMREVLEEAFKDGVFPRPSLHSLAKKVGCHQSTLTRRFPELTKEVKSNHQKFTAIQKEVRSMMICSFVRRTTLELHEAGYYPSLNQIRMGQPGFVNTRDPLVHEEWKKTMKELGLSYESKTRHAAEKRKP